MSSFSSIEKVKYNQDRQDAVALNEYIIFADERRKTKYILFKFTNNINRALNDIKFEIQEFDEANNLIEKVIFVYNDFNANENEDFVPNAKMKVNYECKTIKATLLYARFDFIKWEAGEFSRIPYTYDEFKNKYRNQYRPEDADLIDGSKLKNTVIESKNKPTNSRKKQNFKIVDVSKKNKVLYPKVITVILSIIALAGVLVSVILYTKRTNAFVIDGIEYKICDKNSVEVVDYEKEATDIVIPAKIDKMNVTKIVDYLFMDNNNLKKVELKSEKIEIGRAAFKNCKNLTEVIGSGISIVRQEAFMNCESLKAISLDTATLIEIDAYNNCINIDTFYAPNATIERKALEGVNQIKVFSYKIFDGYKFGFIFGDDNSSVPKSLKRVETSTPNITYAYFQDCKFDLIIIKSKETKYYEDFMIDFNVQLEY